MWKRCLPIIAITFCLTGCSTSVPGSAHPKETSRQRHEREAQLLREESEQDTLKSRWE
jgi:outer membrane PBP1 activator LpoA protein